MAHENNYTGFLFSLAAIYHITFWAPLGMGILLMVSVYRKIEESKAHKIFLWLSVFFLTVMLAANIEHSIDITLAMAFNLLISQVFFISTTSNNVAQNRSVLPHTRTPLLELSEHYRDAPRNISPSRAIKKEKVVALRKNRSPSA